MNFKESVKNLTEIIDLLKEDIETNNKEMSAVLDSKDIMSLYTILQTLNTIDYHCRGFRAFCKRVRKDFHRNVDEFNYGREFLAIQIINLLNDESDWSWNGKEFDKAAEEIDKYCENGGENNDKSNKKQTRKNK